MCDGITGLNVPLSGQHVLLIYSSKLEIKESFFFFLPIVLCSPSSGTHNLPGLVRPSEIRPLSLLPAVRCNVSDSFIHAVTPAVNFIQR